MGTDKQGKTINLDELAKKNTSVVPAEKPRYSLRQLLSKVSSDNIHREQSTGKAVGGEVWD